MRRYHLRWMGVLVTGFLVVVLMLDQLVLYQDAGPLVPALHSYWLAIHVLAAIIASGAFAVGALALVAVPDQGPRGTTRHGAPRAATCHGCRRRRPSSGSPTGSTPSAFPIWTFAALVAGPIWAEYAWGSYWNWDPKEVWAFITWVIYAAYLHARATAGWRGPGRDRDRAHRLRVAAVQLRGDQLLLRRRQHAQLRRLSYLRSGSVCPGRDALALVQVAQEVLVVVGSDGARGGPPGRRGRSARGRAAATAALDAARTSAYTSAANKMMTSKNLPTPQG